MSRLTVSAQTLAAAAEKANHPQNVWIVAGLIFIVGLIGIGVWVRRRNNRG